MSIAAANLWTRNIYKEYLHRDATPAQEARSSKLASLVVKAGAVIVILLLDPQFSIDLQLIGGVIILQTLPAIVFGLYSRFFHAWGLLAGWAAGLAAGMYMLYDTPNPTTGKAHFGGPQYALSKLGIDTEVDDLHGRHRAGAQHRRGDRRDAAGARRAAAVRGRRDRAGATTAPTPATRASSRCRPDRRRCLPPHADELPSLPQRGERPSHRPGGACNGRRPRGGAPR